MTVNDLNNVIQKLETFTNELKQKNKVLSAALLIGINYAGSESELNGCVNDVMNMKEILINKYGYKQEDIRVLTDDKDNQKQDEKPTKQNILDGIEWLVKKNHSGFNNLFFHFSGHGLQVEDKQGDERDNKDECLVPSDYKTAGIIRDDTLEKNFVSKLKENTNCIAITDACHSGTQFDLRYKYNGGTKNYTYNKKSNITTAPTAPKIITLSGCKDTQTSDDAFYSGSWSGALTKFLLETLKEVDYSITCYGLLSKLKYKLKKNGHSQIPQIGTTHKLKATSVFIELDD